MKIGVIFVLYKTPKKEVGRLKDEVKQLGFKDYKIYFPDNSNNHQGYAYGVNIGLKQALNDGCNLFIVANPDISLKKIKAKDLLVGKKYFDIWGLAMKQDGKIYYGGEIDRWRLSGGLIDKKPKKRFAPVDFVSGSLMIIKKDVIDKIGFFDERYFMYYEEVDFCFRAKKNGFKIGIDSQLVYDHFEVSKNLNFKKDWYLFRNRFLFFWRYSNLKQKIRELIRLPKTIFEEIKKRRFYFNFFSYNFFSILSKVLSFIQFVVLIRFFPPNIFGIYSLSWAHLGMFLPIVDFGTTNFGIINLPQEKKINFSDIFSLRFYLSLVVFFLSIFTVLVLPYSSLIKVCVILVSFVAFQSSFFGSLLIKLTNKESLYQISAISFIFQLLITSAIILTTILFKNIFFVFLVIFIFYLVYSFWCFENLKKSEKKLVIKFDWEKFKKIISYSFIYLLISILARWYSRIDIFLLNFLKGEETVGIYSSAYKFLEALMFLVTSYNLSSLPIFVNFYKNKNYQLLKSKVKKDFFFLSIIGLLTTFSFYYFSPIFLNLFFKNKYLLAIPVLKIIIFSLPLILLTSVFFNYFYTIKKVNFILFLMVFQLIFNFSLNFFLIPKYSYFASAYISLIGEVLNLVFCIFFYKSTYENLS